MAARKTQLPKAPDLENPGTSNPTRSPHAPQRVALLMDLDIGCCRNLVRGVHVYALEKHNWILRNSPCDPKVIAFLKNWKPDGVIATVFDPALGRALARLGRPVVDTAFAIGGLKLPVVDVDHTEVGRLAAEHLRERGYKHFGFLGSKSALYSERRQAAFVQHLSTHGYSVSSFLVEYLYEDLATSNWKRDEPRLQQWLHSLPKPVAIFACNDMAARGLAELCRQLSLRVPDEVAILGADDDELESLLTVPPLSSVAIPAKRVGYEAALTLDRMMSGERVEACCFLPPLHVITRQSTDTLATGDLVASAALRYIREHASEGIRVTTVAQAVGVGRRELERTFRRCLSRSVLDEIHRMRVERVKELLAGTTLPMPAIALRSGFSSAERMAVVFGQVAGTSPTAYRRHLSVNGS